MSERITFNVTNSETLRVVDEYSKKQKISRSQVISTLLDATVPVLKDINRYYQLADELKARLLSGVYQQDLPRRRNVVTAEKYCMEIWESKLEVGKGMTLTVSMARCMFANISDTTVGIMQLAGSKIDISKSSVSLSG